MLVRASAAKHRLPATPAAAVLLLGLIGWLATASAHAAPAPRSAVSVAPTSTVAGSTGNTLAFAFNSLRSGSSNVSVRVPTGAGWTAPQNRDATRPGYVSAARGSCRSAAVAGVERGRTIRVSANCRNGNSFTLTYAAAEAPTVAGPYTFVTRELRSGARVRLSPQPVVTVDPGPTSQLDVTGLADAVGAEQAMTVTAEDEFGNTTPNYRGTVHFAGSGPPAAWVLNDPLFPGFDRFDGFDLPGDYGFTAADAGAHTFTGVKIIFAGDQKVTAADTQDDTITGSQTVTITPGPVIGYNVLEPVSVAHRERLHVISAQIPKQRLTVAAFDSWGNIATSDNGTLTFTWGVAGGGTPGDLPSTLTMVNGTASYDVTWPTRANGDVTILMRARPFPEPPPFGFPRGFTMPVEIDVDLPAANSQVITVPPPIPGSDPTYLLTVPNQNVVIQGPLTVANIPTPAPGAPIVLVLSGVTINGDQVSIPVTVSAPVAGSTGVTIDASTQTSSSGNIVINNSTGSTVLQTGSQLTVTGNLSGAFAPVQVLYPNTAGYQTSGGGPESQTMVATAVAPPTCTGGQTWSVIQAKCV
jgi:hypothetical protein